MGSVCTKWGLLFSHFPMLAGINEEGNKIVLEKEKKLTRIHALWLTVDIHPCHVDKNNQVDCLG